MLPEGLFARLRDDLIDFHKGSLRVRLARLRFGTVRVYHRFLGVFSGLVRALRPAQVLNGAVICLICFLEASLTLH